MKKTTLLMVLLASTFLISSCKKGDEDPKFSFLTRKARLTGDWNMTSGSVSVTSLQGRGTGYNDLYAFNGSDVTLNKTETGGVPTIYTGKYSLSISFKKDGKFTLTENLAGSVLKASGTWNFTSGVGKAKNKEGIVLVITSMEEGASDEHLFNKFGMELTYTITGLRNKKLSLEAGTGLYKDSDGSQVNYHSVYVFKAA